MKIRKILPIFILFFFFWHNGFCQNPNGTADIGIPIYVLKEGSLSVPIGLSYDATGVRVDAQASEFGLNWSLVAGGKIVRIKRGKPDEATRKFTDAEPGNRFKGYKIEGFPDIDSYENDDRFFIYRDIEPDLFSVSAPGVNAQFYITDSGVTKNGTNIVLVSQNQDMTIEFTENTNASGVPTFDYPTDVDTWIHYWGSLNASGWKYYTSFKITLTDGTVYYFGESINQKEYSFSYQTYKNSNYLSGTHQTEAAFVNDVEENSREEILSPNAWNLSRIVRPKGALNGNDNYQQIFFTYARRALVIPVVAFKEDYEDRNCVFPSMAILNYLESPIILKSQLTKIESENVTIEFNAETIKNFENKVTNIRNIIPDYIEGSMSETERKDVAGVKNNSKFPVNIQIYDSHDIPAGYKPATDPLTNILTSEAIKNILITENNTPNKAIAYYLDYDYFNQNNGLNETNNVFLSPEKPKRLRACLKIDNKK